RPPTGSAGGSPSEVTCRVGLPPSRAADKAPMSRTRVGPARPRCRRTGTWHPGERRQSRISIYELLAESSSAASARADPDGDPSSVSASEGSKSDSDRLRLLPFPELAPRVPVGVRLVLEDGGHRVQTLQLLGLTVIVAGAPIADGSSLEQPAHTRGLEGGLLATLANDQALSLAVQAAVLPDSGPVGDVAPGFDPQELPGALHRDLHLGATVDRDHAAHHHLSGLLTDLFAKHRSLLLFLIRPVGPARVTGFEETQTSPPPPAPGTSGAMRRALVIPSCRRDHPSLAFFYLTIRPQIGVRQRERLLSRQVS